MEVVVVGDSLDGHDVASLGLGGEHQARAVEAPVDEHRTGTAVTGAAALLRPGEAELATQGVEQGRVVAGQEVDRVSVDRAGDMSA